MRIELLKFRFFLYYLWMLFPKSSISVSMSFLFRTSVKLEQICFSAWKGKHLLHRRLIIKTSFTYWWTTKRRIFE